MGILDELRDQAESIKTSSETEKERQERLYKYYLDELNPSLIKFYQFLHEFSTHLNFIKLEVNATYELPVVGTFSDFKQGDYRLVADSDTEMKDVKFQFCCERENEFQFLLENPRDVERVEEFFKKNHIHFYCKKERDDRYNVVSGDFRVKSTIPILVRLAADIENSCINVAITNFDGFGVRKVSLKPQQITEALLDRFGNYIVRRESDFLQTRLSDDDMRKIRERMLKEKQEQEQELRDLARAEEEETKQQEKARRGLLNSLFPKTTQ